MEPFEVLREVMRDQVDDTVAGPPLGTRVATHLSSRVISAAVSGAQFIMPTASRLEPLLESLAGEQVFISGGAGFIGSSLAGVLVPRTRVTVYDNSFAGDALSRTAHAHHPNLTVVREEFSISPRCPTRCGPPATSFTAPASLAWTQ